MGKRPLIRIEFPYDFELKEELLQYLRHVEKTTADKMKLSLNVNKILKEDRELLEKLAK